jgi:CRISPR/Cas system-associated exonuclease Cas4 (RecB family)
MSIDISQSAISVYRECPYAYKLHYIDRFEAIFWNHDILDIGNIVHETIDEYYKYHYITSGDANDILSRTYEIFKEKWISSFSIDDFKKAYTCLQNHAAFEANNLSVGINTKPITEADIRKKGYHGIIDYVNLNDGIAIDWKTNVHGTISHIYRMQAYIYKTLFEEAFNEKLKCFYFYFLYPNEIKEINFNSPKQKEIAKYTEDIKNEILKSITEEKFDKQPRIDSGCKSCNYRLYCKFGGGAVV